MCMYVIKIIAHSLFVHCSLINAKEGWQRSATTQSVLCTCIYYRYHVTRLGMT